MFVRYEAEVPNVLPYFIGLDRSTKTVVLAIRGVVCGWAQGLFQCQVEDIGAWTGRAGGGVGLGVAVHSRLRGPRSRTCDPATPHQAKERTNGNAGSLSLDDVVRDLLMEPASLDAWLDAPTVWGAPVPEIPMAGPETTMSGHAGMCEAARATIMDLQVCLL